MKNIASLTKMGKRIIQFLKIYLFMVRFEVEAGCPVYMNDD